MRATSAQLGELARAAGVRMTVIHHAFHYRKELKGKATAAGYAAFSELPLQAAERVFAVLDDIPEVERKPRQVKAKSALPDDFQVPDDWIDQARKDKSWPLNQCQAEAAKFVRHHQMKGTVNANWKLAWVHWYDAPWKENGKPVTTFADFSDPERRREYLEGLK